MNFELRIFGKLLTRSTRCTHFSTFGIQLRNHEKRCGQASAGRSTRPRKRSYQTAPLESNRKTMKSAAGKRPPDKAHNTPEKKLSSRIRSAFKNSAKFRQTFSHFYNTIFEISLIFSKSCPKFTNFDEDSPEFQRFLRKRPTSLRI